MEGVASFKMRNCLTFLFSNFWTIQIHERQFQKVNQLGYHHMVNNVYAGTRHPIVKVDSIG